MERINKVLARSTGFSRRDIDRLIDEGAVEIDGKTILSKGCKKQKLRAHSEMLPNRAVNEWALSFLPNLDIQVEAKMKNQAAEQLHTQAEELGLV